MVSIRRNIINAEIEKRIITGLITDDNYCSQLTKMAKKQYFKGDFSRQVFLWCADYFKLYKKAPGKEIQNIFAVEKDGLNSADAELIKVFLSNLSDQYEAEKKANYALLVDQSRDYFRQRALVLLAEKISGEVAKGRVDQAEAEIRNFNRISKDISNWFNPLEVSAVDTVFQDDESNKLFRFSGALGEMVGDLERDWLVAFMAPLKRGKSWWLQELAIHALMNGLKVAYFSFEMNRNAVSKRLYKRLSALASKTGDHKFPIFDCQRNQDGTCKRQGRVCDVAIKAPAAPTPEFKKFDGYKPCTACRGTKNGQYEVATWWSVQRQVKEFDSRTVARKVKDFRMLYGNNLRVMAYPAFSASFDDAERDLDELESQGGFIPDVIAYDYFDISNPGGGVGGLSERGVSDYVWKRGKGQASKRHCLVATVLQSNRKSISKKNLEQEDTAEDIRKGAHVDLLLAINQKPEEKEQGVSRISVIAHRHEEFSFSGEAMVLQSFALGQPFLDDEYVKIN